MEVAMVRGIFHFCAEEMMFFSVNLSINLSARFQDEFSLNFF